MNIGGALLQRYDPAPRPPRRDRPPSTWDRLMAHAVFASGLVGLIALAFEGWTSEPSAKATVTVALAFVALVAALRAWAWLTGPSADRMHEDPEDGTVDLMLRPGWRRPWRSAWWSVRRQPIVLRVGGREFATTALGVTPMQRALTRLAFVALVAAWAVAGHWGWVWAPVRWPRRRRGTLLRWIFGLDPAGAP